MKKTLGGDRLGAGKRMKVELHGYERSTHDLGYLWRSTASAGTLVPFLCKVALPGDTWDIQLDLHALTHPTIGPLFGSYKAQLDVFQIPIRLYQGQLHNNKIGIGMRMQDVKLPQIRLFVDPAAPINEADPDNSQVNPSCILSYLGIRGVGLVDPLEPELVERDFNGLPLLMYWDIFKNYYSNKQELFAYVIHEENTALVESVDTVVLGGGNVVEAPAFGNTSITAPVAFTINYTGVVPPKLQQILFNTERGQIRADAVLIDVTDTGTALTGKWNYARTQRISVASWQYISNSDIPISEPKLRAFGLENLDTMREEILTSTQTTTPFIVNEQEIEPYSFLLNWQDGQSPYINSQEGLAVKTYNSDLFNNWLSTEWIDGVNGVSQVTAIDTSGGSFTIDTLNLSKKVYDMLNRIAVSGGTFNDWIEVTWDTHAQRLAESPVYEGGLIRELIFQEVISNSESPSTADGSQPLGTIAGKGTLSGKKKGGFVSIRVGEPSYIMGIVSLTPRIDYSQGNNWDSHLQTMDDFHKPALDQIGFQDLIQEQMAWWTTHKTLAGTTFVQQSAGKQPAWINYMTSVNETRGNFAIQDNEMFMTLNRRYEMISTNLIKDLTTYIDPSKFNQSFAQTALDAQNFWLQIAVDATVRRKMSAKIMPNI